MPFFYVLHFTSNTIIKYNGFSLRLLLFLFIYFHSCNSGKSEEEMDELWSKAQTTGQIINRSGTKFNSGQIKNLL